MSALHDPDHGVAGGPRRSELRRQHQLLGRPRLERQDRPYDDAERALGSDEEAGEVVPGDPLRRTAAGGHEPSVGQHHVEAEDVLGRHPVLHTAQAAGGRADVPADRAHLPAGGVRRVVQTVFVHGAGEGGVDDAGFHDGDPVDRVDLQDAVHLHQRQHDAAVGGVGGAGQAGAGALRDDRDTQLGRDPHDVLDLFDGTGQDDGGGVPASQKLAMSFAYEAVMSGSIRTASAGRPLSRRSTRLPVTSSRGASIRLMITASHSGPSV